MVTSAEVSTVGACSLSRAARCPGGGVTPLQLSACSTNCTSNSEEQAGVGLGVGCCCRRFFFPALGFFLTSVLVGSEHLIFLLFFKAVSLGVGGILGLSGALALPLMTLAFFFGGGATFPGRAGVGGATWGEEECFSF